MHKRILIAIIAATVLMVGAYTVFVFVDRSTNVNDDNSNGNVNANTNTTYAAPVVSGNIVLNKSVTYRDVTFMFETALATATYNGKTAGEGKRYVILFLKPFAAALKSDPATWAGTEVHLTPTAVDDLTYVPYEVSIPSSAGQRGGFFSFVVPDDQKDFSIVFGSGASTQSIAFSV